jgi:hypothetical protein
VFRGGRLGRFVQFRAKFAEFNGLTCLGAASYDQPIRFFGRTRHERNFIARREKEVMQIRRVLALFLALFVAAASLDAQNAQKDEKKRNKQEQQDIEALVKMVDGVSMGQQQAPGDVAITWDGNHFVKGQDGKTYIPFTINIDRSKLAAAPVAMYVRVMPKQAAATAATGTAGAKKDEKKNDDKPEYPWDNVHFVDIPANGKVSRAMAVPGGEYEVFIAVKEKGTGDRKQVAKTGLLRQDLTVPNFAESELTTSSVIVADAVEPVQTAMTNEQQQENPYTFGSMRIVPSVDPKFNKTGELQVVFWIYGAMQDAATKKPDVQIEYNFHQKTGEGEKYFNKTAPQQLNATTLPPQFDMAAGHQLPGSLVVPLASFPAGEYRLEIKITDKPSGKTLTRDVPFTVEG